MDDQLRRIYARSHRRRYHRGQYHKYPLPRHFGRTYRNSHKGGKGKWVALVLALVVCIVIGVGYTYHRKLESDRRKTIGNLLVTALEPVGSTMYIWGGGWNDEDNDSGGGSVQIGVSPKWAEFASKQDASYDFEATRFQREKGLDCSGYIGWCVYNVMETKSNKEGYVVKSTCMALNYSKRGWGKFTEIGKVRDWKAGDIMSKDGHVWMVVGRCRDGSVVFLHSTPPGISLAGTLLADGSESEATKLAERYMRIYFPDWYVRYPDCRRNYSYLTDSASMRWNRKTLSDEEGLTEMTAAEVLAWMFAEYRK